MKDSVSSYIEHLFHEFSFPNQENNPCQGIETVSIIVNKKRWKKCKKQNEFEPAQHPPITFRLSRLSKPNKQDYVTRHSSMPELSECIRQVPLRNKSGHGNDIKQTKIYQSAFHSKFVANVVSEHRIDNWFLNPFNYPSRTKWKIYRCQLGAVEDSCCCSCNSDAMFEVMKGLYDCYKAKNCDGCECVLCGYKTAEERKIDKLKKSIGSSAREKVLEGKTPEEKEFILKEMAKTRQPLPSGKTPSDKALVNRIRKELGLPPAPKNAIEKSKMRKAEAAGIITPLEGKTPQQKEKILRAQADMGLPLPEGRTDSEKALIEKVKASKKPSMKSALLTPLTGKTPEEKEQILRGRAMKGLPLPEAQTPSEKKIIAKVRADLGLPKDPTTKSMKDKHEQAAKAGLLQPLEGKTPAEKEKILNGLRSFGIPLPEGRTPSEKALIAKVKASPRTFVAPSEQLRRAKAEGLLTPLAGKPPEEKERILKGLAMKGLPLPEATSPSEKKLIEKVRADLGLPKEPDTKSMKDKYEQAAKAGLLQPLEALTPEDKEKTLKGLHDLGIPLPEGRTPSEKALVAKVKSTPREGSIKTAGMMTPLAGKTPAAKEKILRARAKKGIPLPEGTTPSEKKIIDKVRADLGLPKEPDTKSMKAKHEQAARAGLLEPLEGKTPAQKEALLKGLRDLGIPLPEGRTPSEKDLIAKVNFKPRSMVSPSEQLRRAKAEGLMTPLAGKTPAQKEKILKGLAMKGIPLPEAKSPSEKKLIDKVRDDLGLPKEPDTKSLKEKYEQAAKAGILQPLVGKTPQEKEKILQAQHDLGIPLPEGRTPSEKALIAKIKASPPAGSIKTAGVMTPLAGKAPALKEKVLRARAKKGIPLPEGTTPSEKKIIDKVRADLGLPKEPDTKSMKAKHEQAAKAGLLEPLEGKTPAQKEAQLKGLRDMGIPLPEGRTPSEKALIAKIKGAPRSMVSPSEQLRRAKAEGLMTPLAGKTPAQKEKILKGLAMKGIPLPEGKSPSEKKLIDKVRDDLGLPKEPDTKSLKDKYERAAKAGLLQPLVGKTPEEKEKILQGQYDLGIPLPEGRTPSEKALINKIKALPAGSIKTAGIMTPLAGKSPLAKEKVLRARAKKGIPLPEGTTPSEKKIIDKVRADLGLPKEPDTKSMKAKHEQAAKAGLLEPLEGKTPAQKEAQLKGLRDMGIPLPEGRTPSEKALIAKIKGAPRSMVSPSEQLRRAKAEGLMTPLAGKTPAQKEKILKGLAMKGIPLPEGKSPSEKKLIDKVRDDLGLPKEPDTKSLKDKYERAAKAGLLQPLVGKTPEEKEKILQGQYDLGIPLPEGRTPSEKALINKIKALPAGSIKTAGIMTPLAGKSPLAKEKVLRARAKKGIPLPEGTTPSEKKIIDKVRADLGLPKEPDTKSMKAKHEQAAKAGLLQPLEGKTPAQKEAQLKGLRDMGIPLPEGRTPSEKALIAKIKGAPRSMVSPSEQLRRAKAEGLMTPLAGKTPAQKEKILKGLAMKGIPLPEGKTPSEKKLIDKVRDDLGLPKEPDTKSLRDKYERAAKAGLLQPLVGKTPEEKEKILQGQHNFGIPLPEGRTPSEKALIAKVKASPRAAVAPSEQLRRAKAEGLLTPLTGKTPEQKEKILKGLAMKGLPLPIPQTPSEKKLVNKIRADLGLPKEPTTKALRDKHEQAAKAGLLQPLEGMTPEQKEKTLKGLRDMGIPLPEGRTPSEKALIGKIKGAPRSMVSPSEQLRRAKEEGLLTPLTGKTPEQKEEILKGLAMKGLPLPVPRTPSEKKLVNKIRADLGLPREPTTKALRDKHEKAAKAGLLMPLEGMTPEEKEKTLKGLRNLGIPLPEGRTPSEKSLIAKIKSAPRSMVSPSEQLRRAKEEGLLTPLKGKTPEQKEDILKGLAMKGLPLPIPQTPSEKKLVNKVRADLGLPKEPTSKALRDKHEKAAKAGLLMPLEGMTPEEKEKTLKGLRDMGIPLPEGRTPSEKSLIAKIKSAPRSIVSPSEQLRRAKDEGLLTPLKGKTPEQKEDILKGLAMKGLPLPIPQTPSEKKLVNKVRADLGLPKEPTSKALRDKHEKAAKAGLLMPLEGMTPEEKEKTLKGLRDMGIPLPEGRTPSEKALIAKVRGAPRSIVSPSEQLRRAKDEGLLTPLKGKTPEQKEDILKGLAMKGLPLPIPQTPSEKKLVNKVRADLGLPKEPTTKALRDKHEKAAKAGLLMPLEGMTPEEKEKTLKGLRDMGIPLPEGRTPSEKSLIAKIKSAPRSIVSPSEQLRRAKDEGLLTPLKGKTPEQKEDILKGLAMKGLPLPIPQTPSEKKLVNKVRADLGLPKEPTTKALRDKHEKAAKAGLLLPLEGMTPEEKEKTLKGLQEMGIPLPEGRTPSEKALVAKVKAETKKAESVPTITTEKIRQAKEAGLLTPLAGKTPEQKEELLRGLAQTGLPLPVGKTPSEKALIKKVKDEFGIPDRTPSEKLRRAKAAGLLTPLEGKTPAQKEKILRGRAAAGLPLPMDKTPSERALIKKIKDETGYVTPSPSEKIRKAKAAGLMTPLEGKTPAEKEKIVKALAEAGLPLPLGKTKSEKSMIAKIKARTPPEGKTPSEKSIIGKAKAAGLFTPITGKAPAEKERILKGLADAGLPLPEGKTASEKELVKKIRAEAGLPPEPTPSEKKGKIRKKPKKVGVSASKKAAGIAAEEIEEIVKTTKCDRACGCDRKKIRFKHSYVKIRVTSPDISSFCDCPDECLPGVKAGAFVDNEGIKVTIGSAVGIPSYSTVSINQVTPDKMVSNTDLSKAPTNYYNNVNILKNSKYKFSSFESGLNNNKVNVNLNISSSDISYNTKLSNTNMHNRIAQYPEKFMESFKDLQSMEYIYKKPISETKSESSFETILIIRNDMSLSTSTSNSTGSIILTSNMDSSISSSSAQYSGYQSTNDLLSINSMDGPTSSDDYIDHPTIRDRNAIRNIGAAIPQQFTILRMAPLEDKGNNKINNKMKDSETKDPILFNGLPSNLDVSKLMLKITARERFEDASSIFIVVPMSEDEEGEDSSKSVDSKTSVRSSERPFSANTTSIVAADPPRPDGLRTELGAQICGKGIKFYLQEIPSTIDTETMLLNESEPVQRCIEMVKDEFCQISRPYEIVGMLEKEAQAVGSDMTADRPCIKQHNAAHVTSRQITPLFLKGKSGSWFRCKKSTESSEYNTCQCFEPTCSPVPPCCRRECSPPHQTQRSPSPSDCSPADLMVKRNRPAEVQMPSIESTCHEGGTVLKNTGVPWFRWGLRKVSASSSVPECNIPVCTDLSSNLVPSFNSRDHGRNQQLQTPASTASWVCVSDLEGTRKLSAKVGKSWFRLPRMRNAFASCDIPPSCDFRFCPAPPNYSRHRGRGQNHSKKNRLDDLEVTKNRSAKVQKPSIRPTCRVGQSATKNTGMGISWLRFPSSCDCETATAADTPTCDPSVVCHKPPVQNLCFQDQKPSAEIIDSETTPKISGILKWLSWTRISSKRKKSAPSIPTCGVPQYFDSSSSPQLSDQFCHHGRNQQNQTGTSPPPCASPLVELIVKRNRSAKVQKPSIQSIYQKDETTWQGVTLNGPCLASKHTSVPSINMSGVPTYIDSSCSPVPPHQTHHSGRNEKSQSSAAPSLCAYPPDGRKVKRNRSGVSLSWSRIPWLCLPGKRKTSAPSIKTCDVPQYVDSSCSPVPIEQPHRQGCNEQSQTSAITFFTCPPDDWKVKRNPSAKVQKPSIESIYHEGETTSNIISVTLSWSRLPSKRKTYTPAITSSGIPQCPRLHSRNEHTQTPKPLHGYSTHDLEVMKNPSAYKETVRRQDGTAPKKTGIASGWFRLPGMRKTLSKFPNKPKNMESIKASKPKPNPLNLSVSNSELSGQPTSGLIFQLQQMSTIKQKYSREIHCPFRKQNPISQPDLAKEIVKIPDYVNQQSAKPKKETASVQQKLASIKIIEPEGDKSMSLIELKSLKKQRNPKIEIQSKENKPKLNTVKLYDLKPEIDNNLPMPRQVSQPQHMSQIEKKEYRPICRLCPEEISQPVSSKEIVKLSNPTDHQPVKLAKGILPVLLKQVNTKTVDQTNGEIVCECRKDKPIRSKDQENPKTGKQKKKDIICECKKDNPMSQKDLENSKISTQKQKITEQLPKPRQKRYPLELLPAVLGRLPVETTEGYLYESIGPSCKWSDTGEIKKLRSELTQSTSGFEACRRKTLKKSQDLEHNYIELDFADAIRYFANINPERFQQFMQEELDSQLKAEEDKRKHEKKLEKRIKNVRKKSEKEAKKGKKDKTTTTEDPISDESESDYPQGFKFTFAVKNGLTGHAGVDCSKINRSR